MANHTQMPLKVSKKDLQPIFSELSEKDMRTLYNYSEIMGLTTGKVLMRVGDTDQTMYVILQGELKIFKNMNGQPNQIAVLRKGDWIGEPLFSRKVPRTVSAVAGTPSVVMAISMATLDVLSSKVQLFFMKKLNMLASEHISQLASRERELISLNKRLLDCLHSERFQGQVDYSDSKMVMGIIKKIPRLPSFASNMLTRLANKNVSLREAADLIKQDPSSVAVVLKTINSAYYGLRTKVSSLDHAAVFLGLDTLYQLIIADGLRSTLPNTPSFNELHSHSIAISNIAFELSLISKIGRPPEMAVIGLLHDLGRGVILLLKKQNPAFGILIDSLDHARLGALLLKEWGVSDMLSRSLEFQSYPELLPPERIPMEVRNDVAILYLAHLCFSLLEGKSEHALPSMFAIDYMRLLGWAPPDLNHLFQKSLLPALTKKFASYPTAFRQFLKKYEHIRK
jgi:HD-like signal output (HDOD) protein